MFNAANFLTLLRLALVPIFLVVFFVESGTSTGWRLVAFGVFALAAFTDRLDGEIARRWSLVTDFGKIADPIADKALIGAGLIGLSALGELSWWVTVVIGVREIGVTVLRFWVIRYGVIAASRGGKAKTMAQSLAVGLYVLPLADPLHVGAQALMVVAVVLTVVTGVDYGVRAARVRRTGTALRPAEALARQRHP